MVVGWLAIVGIMALSLWIVMMLAPQLAGRPPA
jgi:hypothetical protein